MSTLSRDRKYRLRDFNSFYSGRDDIYIHKSLKHQYTTIHPFADDTELLNKLNIAPEDCRSVDAYWHMESDISFLQVFAHNDSTIFRMRWAKEKKSLLNINISVEESYITKYLFEEIMLKIWSKGIRPNAKLKRRLSDGLIQI